MEKTGKKIDEITLAKIKPKVNLPAKASVSTTINEIKQKKPVQIEGRCLSKTETVSFTCPVCKFSVNTPFGKQDASEHIKLHADKHHNDKVTRARISKNDLLKLQ